MLKPVSVVKVSGHCLDDHELIRRFASVAAACDEHLVIVHGGGVEISQLQQKLAIEPQYVDGLRVTDADSLALVEMVLCGSVNKRLVRYLLSAGVDALGLSGVDRGLIRARKMRHESLDMGYTGEVVSVRGEVITDLLERGVTPVVAPVSVGACSNYNLNADTVAGAVAAAIGAQMVVFISNVAGVLIDGNRVASMTRSQARELIGRGLIHGGMIPKVESALAVLSSGVPQAVITDLDGWAKRAGTTFVGSDEESRVSEELCQ